MKKLLLILTIFLIPNLCFGAIAFDAITQPSNDSTCTSFTHTPVGSTNLFASVAVATNSGDNVTAITYGGQAMSLVAKQDRGGGKWQFMYVLQAPPTGAQTVAITSTESSQCKRSAITYTGVAQTGQPTATANTTGSGTTASLTVTVGASSVIIGTIDTAVGINSASTNTTWRGSDNDASYGDTTGSVGASSINFDIGSGAWGMIGVAVSPPGGATAPKVPAIISWNGYW